MASGDRIRVATHSQLETTNENVASLESTVGDITGVGSNVHITNTDLTVEDATSPTVAEITTYCTNYSIVGSYIVYTYENGTDDITLNYYVDSAGDVVQVSSDTGDAVEISTTATFINYTDNNGDQLEAGKLYYVDTTSGSISLVLPTTDVEEGALIDLQDQESMWGTNYVVLSQEDGGDVYGDESTYTLDISDITIQCVYNGTYWEVHSTGYSRSVDSNSTTRSLLYVQQSSTQSVVVDDAVLFGTTLHAKGSAISYNSGTFTLTGGKTYKIKADIKANYDSSVGVQRIGFAWYNVTDSEWIGSAQPIFSMYDDTNGGVAFTPAEHVFEPGADVELQLRCNYLDTGGQSLVGAMADGDTTHPELYYGRALLEVITDIDMSVEESITAYAVMVDTNTSNNALTTTSEVADLDEIYNSNNVTLDKGNDWFSIDAGDISYIRIDQEYQLYYSAASEAYTSYLRFMWGLFYSDDNGSTWNSDNHLRGIIRVPNNVLYTSPTASVTIPHVSGRVYQMRRASSSTSLYLMGYNSDEDTMTDVNGTAYDVPTYPLRLTVTGW